MLSKENRFSKGVLPADTKEKVLEVEDGIVTKKEVDGNIYLRKKCARFGTMFWEAEELHSTALFHLKRIGAAK